MVFTTCQIANVKASARKALCTTWRDLPVLCGFIIGVVAPTSLLEPCIRRLHTVTSIFKNFEFETQLFVNPKFETEEKDTPFFCGTFQENV